MTCFDTNFYEKYCRFLLISFYWLEFHKCFNLVLLLAVLLIVYINLAEPSSGSSDIALSDTLTVFPQRGSWSRVSQYPTPNRTL